jgi:acyl-coenzyme A synthetase/AMP-(fatty) acid ligase
VLTDSAAAALRGNDDPSSSSSSAAATLALTRELQEFCKRNAAPYKYPRKIEFVDAAFLPKTISGKIKRAELKSLERRRYQQEGRAGAKL